jgi:hypothetical protein
LLLRISAAADRNQAAGRFESGDCSVDAVGRLIRRRKLLIRRCMRAGSPLQIAGSTRSGDWFAAAICSVDGVWRPIRRSNLLIPRCTRLLHHSNLLMRRMPAAGSPWQVAESTLLAAGSPPQIADPAVAHG